jgi:hypothetical protein
MKQFLEKKYKLIVFLILSFMFIVSVLNANNDSAIFDETAHIGAAYSYVTQHEIRLNPEHPPLIKDLAGLPLLFLNLNFDVSGQSFWNGTMPKKWDEGQWAAGRYLLYQVGNNPDAIIFWARFPIILLSLLLGWFIFFWAKKLFGISGGLLALVFYAFDPNILGHNHFVTTDIGIAAFLTFSFYYYIKFIKNPSWKNVLWAGIFLGLLQLSKFSFLIAFPIFALITILYPLVVRAEISRIKKFGEYVGKGAIVFSLSMIVMWGVYALNTFKMKPETISQAIDATFSLADTNPKNIYTNKTLHWLNDNSLIRPLAIYGEGIGYVFRRVSGGNGAYFLGHVSSTASKSYFPIVFLIKEPLPGLFLMLFALVFALIKIIRTATKFPKQIFRNISHYLRSNILEFSMFSFIFLYAYLSITGNLNIGFRHLFPILPFAYILTAKSIVEFIKNHNRLIFKLAIGILLIFLIVETIMVYPSYMSYFNSLVGGPKNGYNYVTDSNADWGQDLKRLKYFLDKNPAINKIRVDYFGGGDIYHYIGQDKAILWWDSKRPIESGWYAISTNFLQGSLYETGKNPQNSYQWLWKINKKPTYQVGTSLLIYNITPEDLKKL